MRDQVDALVDKKVNAASLDSTQGLERSTWIKDEVLNGNMKILFVAPERCVASTSQQWTPLNLSTRPKAQQRGLQRHTLL